MRLPTLSAALSLLLLALSCLTARCDAACDLASIHGTCHPAENASALKASSHCMSMPGPTTTATLVVPQTPCLQHHLCLIPATAHTPATPALPLATLPPPATTTASLLPLSPSTPIPPPPLLPHPPRLRSTLLRI